MHHPFVPGPIVQELRPISLYAQGPHLSVPSDSKLAHVVKARALLVVDGRRNPATGLRGHKEIPACDGFPDMPTGAVHLDHIAIVKEDAQGVVFMPLDADNVVHIDQGPLDFYKSAHTFAPFVNCELPVSGTIHTAHRLMGPGDGKCLFRGARVPLRAAEPGSRSFGRRTAWHSCRIVVTKELYKTRREKRGASPA